MEATCARITSLPLSSSAAQKFEDTLDNHLSLLPLAFPSPSLSMIRTVSVRTRHIDRAVRFRRLSF